MKISISPSSLSTFQSCPERYHLSKILGFQSKEKAIPLEKGDFFHKVLEYHYNEKEGERNYQDIIKRSREYGLEKNLDSSEIEDCLRVYRDYFQFYTHEPFEILGVEVPFSEIFFDMGEDQVFLEGKIDLLVKQNDKVFPIDHKTSQRFTSPEKRSNQFFCYVYVTKSNILMMNRIGLHKGNLSWTERFTRPLLSYEPEIINEWVEETKRDCEEILESIKKNRFRMRTASCWNCQFSEVCGSRPDSREFKLGRDFNKVENFDLFAERVS